MSSTVDPLKLLNRGPAYLRSAFQTQSANRATPTLSAAERLNVRKKSGELKNDQKRPQTAPIQCTKPTQNPPKRSEFETWTAEQLVNRGSESKQNPGYAARMLATTNQRPKTAQPYSLMQQRRRNPVRGNHNAIQGKHTRERSNSVDRFFDTLGGTFLPSSNPPSLVPSGSVSDLSGLSRAASQNIRSRSDSTESLNNPESETNEAKKLKPEVSQVEKRIRVMLWLSNCKPQPHMSTPVKG